MSTDGQRGVAVLCVLLVALAAVSGPVTAGTESSEPVSASDSLVAPSIDAPNVTIDDATPSNVTVSYNLTGEVTDGDLDVVLATPKGTIARNASLPASGNATLTIPADAFGGGEFQYVVYGWNATSERAVPGSFESAWLNVTSNSSVTSFEVDSTTVYEGQNVTVNATVTNPGPTDENVTVGPYWEMASGQTNFLGYNLGKTVEVKAGATTNVTFEGSFPDSGTFDLWVNNQSATTVTVEQASPVSEANTTATAVNVTPGTVSTSETATVNVTLENPGSVDETVGLSPFSYNQRDASQSSNVWATVNASETKTVSIPVNYSTYGDWTTSVAGFDVPVTVLASGTNVVFRRLSDNETVVAGERQSLDAEVTNYGDADGTTTLNLTYGNGTLVDNETVTLNATESTFVALEATFGPGEYDLVYEDDGEPFSQNLTVRPNPVVSTNLTVVGGTEPNGTVNASASYDSNGLNVEVVNATGGTELATEGVDATTQFRLNVTVQNLTSRLFVGTARNASWDRVPINDTHTTYVFAGTPAEEQFLRGAPDLDNWPTNGSKQATFAREQTFSFTGFQLESAPADHQDRLNGTLIATDAQTFGTPEYVNRTGEEPKFTIELAAPHYEAAEVNGSKVVNDGFYEAHLPSQLVDQWNVSDPESELNAVYQGSDEAFTASSLPDGGLAVSLDIHYSAGSVSVSPSGGDSTDSTDSADSTDSTDSATDSTTDSTGDTSDPVDFDDADDDSGAPVESPDERVVEVANESDGDAPVSVDNVSAGTNVTVNFGPADENESANETAGEGADDAADGNESAPPASVETVNVSVAADASFTMNVSSSASAPAPAADEPLPEGTDVSAYVSVEHDGLTNADIDGASLTLSVSKSRFDSAADAANATVLRLHDGEWQHLDTALAGETADSYRFHADSPGLSVFAVAEPDPSLTVTDAALDAADATVGDTVTVTASVTNDGGAGEASVALTVDGDSVATKQLSLDADETTTVAFEHELASAGALDVAVENASAGSLSVAQQTETTTATATTAEPTSSTDANTPGFGVLVAVLALLAAAGVRARD